VGTPTLAVSLFLGAAALALWSDVRLGERGPTSFLHILIHALAAFMVLRFARGAVVLAAESGETSRVMFALLGVLLPALVYVFLASLWVLKTVRGALPR
jgi:hypothetical protein